MNRYKSIKYLAISLTVLATVFSVFSSGMHGVSASPLTVNFQSNGDEAFTVDHVGNDYNISSGVAVTIGRAPNWGQTLPGSSWISFRSGTQDDGNGPKKGTIAHFTESVNFDGNPTGGSITVLADDTAGVSVNGTLIASPNTEGPFANRCAESGINCTTSTTIQIPEGLLHAGSNAIKFDLYQRERGEQGHDKAPYGLDFIGSITGETVDNPPPPPVNHAPVCPQIASKAVTAGSLLQFSVSASDPDGDELNYTTFNLPPGAIFNNQLFSWTPTANQVGIFNVTFRASDSTRSCDTQVAINVTQASQGNQPPVWSQVPNLTLTVNQIFSLQVFATDPNGDPVTYAATSLPASANFNTGTHTFSWTPTQTGNFTVALTASDGVNAPVTMSFQITVATGASQNQIPVCPQISAKNVTAGTALQFSFIASDPNGDPLTYTTFNLPSGATFTSNLFSWTPNTNQVGVFGFIIRASDGTLFCDAPATVNVLSSGNGGGGGTSNHAPVWPALGSRTVNAGETLSLSLTATDPDGNALTYTAFNLPPGASYSSSGSFSWTPGSNQAGVYSMILRASDGQLTSDATFSIQVLSNTTTSQPPAIIYNPPQQIYYPPAQNYYNYTSPCGYNPYVYTYCPGYSTYQPPQPTYSSYYPTTYNQNRAPVFTAPSQYQSVNVNQNLQFIVTAYDPDGDYVSYGSFNLPAGAAFDNYTHNFSWTPNSSQIGSYTAIFQATDSYNNRTSYSVQITVTGLVAPVTTQAVYYASQPTTVIRYVSTSERLQTYNIRIDNDADLNVIVSWENNKPAHPQVVWGLASQADHNKDFIYEHATPVLGEISTRHAINIGKLEPNRTYYLRTISEIGNERDISAEKSFTQLQGGGVANLGAASIFDFLGNLFGSLWFILLVIILTLLYLLFRRRQRRQLVQEVPLEIPTA